ncbi:MAG: M42 family peptidase, partial [Oscillospiraceae bacterium]|nr:M42 family peptidase [Oscillospiraceae bacterium]
MNNALLKNLCLTNGISGDEYLVKKLIIQEIVHFADEITTDALGNIIVFKKGKQRAKNKLLISA